MVEHRTHPVAEPPRVLVEMWACARATQHAAAWIATRPGADDDLRFTRAAGHCGEAADELQRAHPDVYEHADIPTLAAGLDGLPTATATDRLLVAIATGISDLDADEPRLQTRDVLAAAVAGTWLALAHHAISGRLPTSGLTPQPPY
jgi:hypothetical protein